MRGALAGQNGGRPLAVVLLDDLRAQLNAEKIASDLAEFGGGPGYDAATRRLHGVTGGHLDLRVPAHRVALIGWLRAWGCRHLRRADTERTAEALRVWWESWAVLLPGEHATLTTLGEQELQVAGQAYGVLCAARAASRTVAGRELPVAFGDTAAAKAMFAIRPHVFLPWDEAIRLAFGGARGATAYVTLLQLAAAALNGLALRLAVPVTDLPRILGRPVSTPPKLIDELLLVSIARSRRSARGSGDPAA